MASSSKNRIRQIGAVLVGPEGFVPTQHQGASIRRHYFRMTLEQRVKHKETTDELKRLERAWNLLDALSPASKHYIKSRINDDVRF